MNAPLTKVERRVLEAVDMPALLGRLADLVAIPSLTGDESIAQARVADEMRHVGLDTEVWDIDLDGLRTHPAYSAEVERERAVGVIGTLGGTGEPGGAGEAGAAPRPARDLIVNAHVDVVPPGDESEWATPPWRATVADDKVYGRGANDDKGGLCCALGAAAAIAAAGVRLKGRLLVQSVVGEEDGGTGTLAAVLHGRPADGAVVVEPTGLAVILAQAGALNFRIIVRGRAAHGCVRDEGVSALEKFLPVHAALLELERDRNVEVHDPLFARYRLPIPLNIGTVRAGDWPSTVPDALVCQGRYGVAVGESTAAARGLFEAAVRTAARSDPWLRDHPPSIVWSGGQFEPAATPPDAAIVGAVTDALKALGVPSPRLEGVTYGADMRLLVNAGRTPTVLFGPGDVRHCHCSNEFVPIAELETATRVLALTALRFCGVAD